MTSRRGFVARGAAFAAYAGLASRAGFAADSPGGRPELSVGVLSDIHVTKLDNAQWFEKALRKFDAERVDAVLVAGDLATWSRPVEFRAVAETWRKVFPDGKRSDGGRVERLFVTGNHDVDGFAYSGAKFKSMDEARRNSFFFRRDELWRELFGEPYEPIGIKTVNGYAFVLRNWNSHLAGKFARSPGAFPLAAGIAPEENPAPDFIAGLSGRLPRGKPFFYVQHEPIPGTVPDEPLRDPGQWVLDATGKALAAFPNCIALTGHTHYPLTDGHSIWQGEFTAVNCSCARGYMFTRGGRENGYSSGDVDREPPFEMPPLDFRRVRQGMVMRVRQDRVTFERFDIESDVSLGEDWVVPLFDGGRTISGSGEAKYSFGTRSEKSKPPRFAADACVAVKETDDGRRRHPRKNDSADPAPRSQIVVSFPPAVSTATSGRGFDYSVAAEVRYPDFTRVIEEKRVFSPGFAMPESMDVENATCAFARDSIPGNRDVRFVVRPFNCWGKAGDPIFSEWRRFRKAKQS